MGKGSNIDCERQASSIFLVTAACILAVVKGDYFVNANYPTKAICETKDALTDALYAGTALYAINTATCSLEGNGIWSRAGCSSTGQVIKAIFNANTCTDASFVQNITVMEPTSCTANGPLFSTGKCYSGTFKSSVRIATMKGFTDAQCSVSESFIKQATSAMMYPLDTCIDAFSAKITCSGGKPVRTLYNGTKCTGVSQSSPTSLECTKDSSGSTYEKWEACTSSSGASSTSVTILSFVLLVLATFSSTM